MVCDWYNHGRKTSQVRFASSGEQIQARTPFWMETLVVTSSSGTFSKLAELLTEVDFLFSLDLRSFACCGIIYQ